MSITHITSKDIMFQSFTLNDINVIKLLIEYRYKYDENLFLGGGSIMQASDTPSINQELIATYASLDSLIKQCDFSEQQMKLLEMTEHGYTFQEIEEETNIATQNVNKALKSIYKSIAKENERQWRKTIYVNKLGLKTKKCFKCSEVLPATNEFYSDKKDSKDLLHPYCRKCKI